jgi:hypothetical protein
MSRHTRLPLVSSTAPLACALALVVPLASAQTIADYSRAQRTLLESAMVQASARSAGIGAGVPAAGASIAASAPPVPAPKMALPSAAPVVQVSGVFAARDGALAEVVVNATAYLLGVGQGVPGTPWRVQAVAVDCVVLSRRDGVSPTDPDGARRIFALPAMR